MRFILTPARYMIISAILTTIFLVFEPAQATAQDQTPVEATEAVTPARAWEVKIIWRDLRGERQKTKGWLMFVTDDAMIVSVESRSGRPRQQRIHASNIIKVKYKEQAGSALPDVAIGAVQGALSGGYVPVQTGNISVDLLAGALQGAIGGLFQGGSSYSRRVYINRRTEIFRNYLYPELVAGR